MDTLVRTLACVCLTMPNEVAGDSLIAWAMATLLGDGGRSLDGGECF